MKFKHWLIVASFSLVFLFHLKIEAAAAAKSPSRTNKVRTASTNQTEKTDARTPINPPETALIKQDHVNIRGQPSLTGEVITRLRKGEPVTLLEEIAVKNSKADEPSKWYQIALPTNTPVWINAEYVDPASKAVSARRLNVRAGPGENYSIIARLPKGTEVREIRKVNNWMEIEAPTNAYAFVAAEYIAKQAPTSLPVNPTPAPEIAAATPATPPVANPVESTNTLATAVPAAPVLTPSESAPTPVATNAAPAIVTALRPPPAEEQPLPKRVVTREGIVRRAASIQAPSYFELISSDTGKIMNYLNAEEHKEYNLKLYAGFKVIVTGEELVDPRWPKTPVIQIETLDLP